MQFTKTLALLSTSFVISGCPMEFTPLVDDLIVDPAQEDAGSQTSVDGQVTDDTGVNLRPDGGTDTPDMGMQGPTDTGVPLINPQRLELEILNGTGSSALINPGNLTCTGACELDFEKDTLVTINLNLMNGDQLNRWTGDCTGNGNPCQVRMDMAREVKAHLEVVQHSLQVNLGGAGQGTVQSTPAGILCGSDCNETYDWGTSISLRAEPETGSVFAGWVGACSGTGECIIDLQADVNVTALFEIQQVNLSVSVMGNGTIDSTPGGINCGTDCTETYDWGTSVTLEASAGMNFAFANWGGDCSGSGNCTIVLDGDKQVTAEFTDAPVNLEVRITGNGGGNISSAPAGITCPGTCQSLFPRNQMITLTAQADTGSELSSWSGACSGSGSTCTVTMDQAKQVTADFALLRHRIDVTRAGSAPTGGTVASMPSGISCGTVCAATYNYGTTITLRAIALVGFEFDGWTGACVGSGQSCTLQMLRDQNVTANFKIKTHDLSVSRSGPNPNGGTISSSPGSINCGTQCNESFDYGADITLTATPLTGYDFDGWTQDCSSSGGTTDCRLQMTADRNASARFRIQRYSLIVQLTGNQASDGYVFSTPAGIDCSNDCEEEYDYNTQVRLTALANNGAIFAGWAGSGCSGTGTCTVTMNQAHNVSAQFDMPDFELTVSTIGSGAGHIRSIPAGIDCPGTCNASFAAGTNVSLVPTPNAFSGFSGWTADCTGPGDCSVTVSSNKRVTAEFEDGLVAFYALSGNGTDNSRNGHDATTNVGSAAEGHNGNANTAVLLGQGQYFEISDDPALSGFDNMTICGWTYITSWAGGEKYLASKVYLNSGTGDDDSYALYVGTNRYPSFLVSTTNTSGDGEWSQVQDNRSSSRVSRNDWVHLCGVYDGQDAIIYTNGSFGRDDGISGTVNATTRPARLGQCTSANPTFNCVATSGAMYGRIDNIKIYNRALSATEINTEFQR